MNRRSFVAASAASLVSMYSLTAARAQSTLVLESRLTGAELDFAGTGFEFVDHKMTTSTDGGSTERFEVMSDLSTLVIQFTSWVPKLTTTDAYELALETLEEDFGASGVDDLGLNDLDDGAWMAFRSVSSEHGAMLWYNEFQQEAFPDIDLLVEISFPESDLEAALDEAQQVNIAGMPPFLFMAESGVTEGLFEQAASGTSFERLVVPDRGGSGRSSTQNGATVSDDDVIAAVSEHQQQFQDELSTFDDVVDRVVNGDTSQAEDAELLASLIDLMFIWSVYPDTANELIFPPTLAALETVYLDWADGIGHMGMAMGQWLLGDAEIDPFIDAMEIAVDLDQQLTVALTAAGSQRGSGSTPAVDGLIARMVTIQHRGLRLQLSPGV